MILTYDSSVDALDISLRPDTRIVKTILIDERRNVDLGAEGEVVAIEILSPSQDFELGDIIERFHLHDLKDELQHILEMDFRPAERV